MIVTCENCDTSFNLDERLVKITGSKVRCSKCRHIFITYPPNPSGGEPLEASGDFESSIGSEFDTGSAGDSDISDERMIDEPSSEAEEPEDLDLSDIEKMLEVGEDAEEDMAAEDDSTAGKPEDDTGDDSLDLSDIEKILDEEEIGEDLAEDKTDDDQDLVFDLDEALEMEAGKDRLSPTSELDLGDLEKLFESEAEETDFLLEDEPLSSHELETGDTDHELLSAEEDNESEDLKIEMEEQSSDLESEESEETLDFDLEPLEESESLRFSSEDDVRELDFDLEDEEEDLLEEPDIEASDSDGDMDLELEMEEPAESVIPEIGETDMSTEDEPSEVSDMDDALEIEETADDFLDSLSEEEEELGDGAEEDELAEQREVALGGPDDGVPDQEPTDLDEDAEFDFPDDAVPDIPDGEEDLMDEEEPIQDEDLEESDAVSGGISPPLEDKSGLKKIAAGLFVIVAVVAIVLAALAFLQNRGIVNVPYLDQLPFLSKLKAPEAPDPGNLKVVVTSEVDSRFLDGGKAGKLFIVTGKVKNDYSHPRSYIQVSGSLYTRGKMLAQTVQAYCGNVFSDLELLKMEAPEIQARMENRSGALNSNVGVKPGEERPFMIVFSDIPESLEEFTVTVVSSSAGAE